MSFTSCVHSTKHNLTFSSGYSEVVLMSNLRGIVNRMDSNVPFNLKRNMLISYYI